MYAQIFKDSAASTKAWLSRARALQHTTGSSKTGKWVSVDGKPLEAAVKKHLNSVPIPPGVKDVLISTDPKADLIAKWVDASGKNQSLYSLKHTDTASITKFARVAKLNPKIPSIMNKSRRDMNNSKLSVRERDNAATVHLIAKTGFRPGGDSADAFGASTLQKRHVSVKGEVSIFNFVGKHHVNISKRLTDKDMSTYLGGRLASLKPGDTVFSASGASANRYLKGLVGKDYKVKDLRTWNGTAVARSLISQEPIPSSAVELKAQQKRISTIVSQHLGNTPAVALKSYIDPLLWQHTGGLNAKKG